jgi:hypothetical protein
MTAIEDKKEFASIQTEIKPSQKVLYVRKQKIDHLMAEM